MSIDADTEADTESASASVLPDDVKEAATALGDAIADLPEYERFEEAKTAVQNSAEAQAKIQEFESIRQEFVLMRQTGEASQEDLRKLQAAQEELHEMPVMAEYLNAQNELDARLEAVNDVVSSDLLVDFGEEAGGCCADE